MYKTFAGGQASINRRQSSMIEKVVAYVTRGVDGKLLVFTHTDFPEAGVQVPAGTLEDGEPLEAALMRELHEETGQSGYRLIRRLASYEFALPAGEICLRHVFHLSAPDGLPDRWRWGERVGTAEQINFDFYWTPLRPRPELAGGLGDYLGELSHA
jgi:ADP-ribose pyrophosphatase YjhB (NUDIX family)